MSVNWFITEILSRHRSLPFILELPTTKEKRNELARRILRILQNGSPLVHPKEQDGVYWVNLLAVDHVSGVPILNEEQEVFFHFYLAETIQPDSDPRLGPQVGLPAREGGDSLNKIIHFLVHLAYKGNIVLLGSC